jgi:hypothetical protein
VLQLQLMLFVDWIMTNIQNFSLAKMVSSVPEHEIWRDVKFFGFIDVILKMVIKNPGQFIDQGFSGSLPYPA